MFTQILYMADSGRVLYTRCTHTTKRRVINSDACIRSPKQTRKPVIIFCFFSVNEISTLITAVHVRWPRSSHGGGVRRNPFSSPSHSTAARRPTDLRCSPWGWPSLSPSHVTRSLIRERPRPDFENSPNAIIIFDGIPRTIARREASTAFPRGSHDYRRRSRTRVPGVRKFCEGAKRVLYF